MQTQEAVGVEAVPLERLEAEITELAGHLAAAESRWLSLVGEYDRREGYAEWGCRTCAHWLSWHCGLDLRAARERVRVARALDELPAITSEFAAGRLSYSKVRAITRVATPANESELVALATSATASHVERAVRAYRGVLSAEEETSFDEARHMARYLRYSWADDGSLEGRFRIPPEMASIFLQGVAAARDRIPPEPDHEPDREPDHERCSAEHPRELATTNCDALVLMAESLLADLTAGRSRGDRFQIVVNVDANVLATDTGGTCELEGGPALAPETARRLACDASVVQVTRDARGVPSPRGAKVPSIPSSTRRAVHARDHGCRFPGCGTRLFVNVHHIRHRAHGGGNQLTNLVELCWFHHRLVHEGGWNLRFDTDGRVLAIRPNGNVLPQARAPRSADPERIGRDNSSRGAAIDPNTCIPRWYGDRLELAEVVTSLVSADHKAAEN